MLPTPKAPLKSTTVWAGIVQIVGGAAMALLALLMPDQHADLLMPGMGWITTGIATIRGRLAATQPIG